MNEIGDKMNDSRDSTSKRPHLTKDQRMPSCYKDVEKIIKSVQSCQNNFKTVMANSRFRGAHFKKVYSLALNVLKYYNYIQKIIDKTEILTKETFLRREIASVLIYELIYGKGYLPGASKVVSIVQAYESRIFKIHEELQNDTDACEINETYVPRYVRVHTLKTSVAYVIKDLESYGFKQILYEENIDEEKYLELVRNLERGMFILDFHFKDILVFARDENLIDLDLYKNGHIFLQDKASYIPVHVLNPDPGSTVLDACAAPGMKSAHIASKMENKGILIACDRDTKRFEILKETLDYGSVKIAKTLCTDFKLIDPNDKAYASVEYILLDPSCSGSGMVNRMDEVTNNEGSTSKDRIHKLAGFQIILLKHALKFPSVKRVVYSTCSIHEEENEYVVHEALNAFGNSFKLAPVLPEYFSRGSGSYQYGEMCLRTDPRKHSTNGFFVAVFERIESSENVDKYANKYKKLKSSKVDSKKVYNSDRKSKNDDSWDRKYNTEKAFKQEKESFEFTESNETIVDTKQNFDRGIKIEESCEYGESNNSLNNTNGFKDRNYPSTNYENDNIENVKIKSHKKAKKSKYREQTNITVDKDLEMDTHHCITQKPKNDFSDSFSESGGTNLVQSPTTLLKNSEFDNSVLEEKKSKHKKSIRTEENCELVSEHKSKKKKKKRKYSEILSDDTIPSEVQNNVTNSYVSKVLQVSTCNEGLEDKKLKHKKSYRPEKNFDVTEENCELVSEHKSKKKKERKYSEILSDDTIPTKVQNNITNSYVSEVLRVSKCNEGLGKKKTEETMNFIVEEDKNLETSKPKKHKKKKKKEQDAKESSENRTYDTVCDVDLSINVETPVDSIEIENSSSLKNSDLPSQAMNIYFSDNDKKTKSKKHKHKRHAKKSDCDDLTESLDNSFSTTMEKETNNEDSECNLANKSSFKDKERTKRKNKIDNSHECLNHSTSTLENIDSSQEIMKKFTGSELETVIDNVHVESPKRKKSKKHKSHSKDRDLA